MADNAPSGGVPNEPEPTFRTAWRANFWEFRVARDWSRRVLRMEGKADASHRGGLTRLGQVVVAILALLLIRVLVILVLAVTAVLVGIEPPGDETLRTAAAGTSVSPAAARFELWVWLIGTACLVAVGVWMGIRRNRATQAVQAREAA